MVAPIDIEALSVVTTLMSGTDTRHTMMAEEVYAPVQCAALEAYLDWAEVHPLPEHLGTNPHPRLLARALKRFTADTPLDLSASKTQASNIGQDFLTFLNRQGIPETGTAPSIWTPIAHAFEAKNHQAMADIIWRRAFAQRNRHPAIDAAIERMTQQQLKRGPEVRVIANTEAVHEHWWTLPLQHAGVARAILEERFNTRIPLNAIIDLMHTPGDRHPVQITSYAHYNETQSLRFHARHDLPFFKGDEEYIVDLRQNGSESPEIGFWSICLSPHQTTAGLGTMVASALALFAHRQGIEGWPFTAIEDGILVWPRFGAKRNGEDTSPFLKNLRHLEDSGAILPLQLDGIDLNDPWQIHAITISDEQVIDHSALFSWIESLTLMNDHNLKNLRAPYSIGRYAVESIPMHFETNTLIGHLLHERLPKMIEETRAAPKARAHRRAKQLQYAGETLLRETAMNQLIAHHEERIAGRDPSAPADDDAFVQEAIALDDAVMQDDLTSSLTAVDALLFGGLTAMFPPPTPLVL